MWHSRLRRRPRCARAAHLRTPTCKLLIYTIILVGAYTVTFTQTIKVGNFLQKSKVLQIARVRQCRVRKSSAARRQMAAEPRRRLHASAQGAEATEPAPPSRRRALQGCRGRRHVDPELHHDDRHGVDERPRAPRREGRTARRQRTWVHCEHVECSSALLAVLAVPVVVDAIEPARLKPPLRQLCSCTAVGAVHASMMSSAARLAVATPPPTLRPYASTCARSPCSRHDPASAAAVGRCNCRWSRGLVPARARVSKHAARSCVRS